MTALDRLRVKVQKDEQNRTDERKALWAQMQEKAPELAELVKELQGQGMQPKVTYYEQDGVILHGTKTDIQTDPSTSESECKGCDFCRPGRVDNRDQNPYANRTAKR